MDKTLKKLRLIFSALFLEFISISGILFYLKKVAEYEDIIDMSNKITMIAPVIMLISILVAYYIYDRIAKKSQKLEIEDTEGQTKFFSSAMIIKMGMLNFVGIIAAVMMFLIFQKTYLYMLGIVAVFFLINFPSEVKFRRDFVKRNDIF
ncbi:MAG: hypothetical protein JXR68_11250 [Bacteroidales bacterium]|nr:hypothetical protein [Bacteroidales bacterium]